MEGHLVTEADAFVAFVVGFVVCAIAGLAYVDHQNELFVKGGYCESVLVGHSGTVWVKCPQEQPTILMMPSTPEHSNAPLRPSHQLARAVQ